MKLGFLNKFLAFVAVSALAWGGWAQPAHAQFLFNRGFFFGGGYGAGNCGTGNCGSANAGCDSCGSFMGFFCNNRDCPPKTHHCQERPPQIRIHRGCPRPVCDPCTTPNFGYYQTCWTQWPYPPDWSHCPVPPPASQTSQGTIMAPPVYESPVPVRVMPNGAAQYAPNGATQYVPNGNVIAPRPVPTGPIATPQVPVPNPGTNSVVDEDELAPPRRFTQPMNPGNF